MTRETDFFVVEFKFYCMFSVLAWVIIRSSCFRMDQISFCSLVNGVVSG